MWTNLKAFSFHLDDIHKISPNSLNYALSTYVVKFYNSLIGYLSKVYFKGSNLKMLTIPVLVPTARLFALYDKQFISFPPGLWNTFYIRCSPKFH